MRPLLITFLLFLSSVVRAEITSVEDRFYVPPGQPSMQRNQDEQLIANELNLVLRHLPKDQTTKFIYLNRCVKDVCTTYVVQNNSGRWQLFDKYPTLAGVGVGVGCGSGMTEAGLFAIGTKQASAHSHPHWGEDALLPLEPIKTSEAHECPSHDSEKVIHGRVSLENKSCGIPQEGQTRGCVGVPPDKFDVMAQQAAQGAVIYNFNANN